MVQVPTYGSSATVVPMVYVSVNHSIDRGICAILTCRQQLQEKFSTVLLRNKSAMFQLLCIAKKFIGIWREAVERCVDSFEHVCEYRSSRTSALL